MTDARIRAGLGDCPAAVDLLVIGLGVTGAGVALDAAARGLSVLAVDAHDIAFGTSRWSSKLAHGGLRYLASGQVAIAMESARERGIMIERTAPHLVRPLPFVIPFTAQVGKKQAALAFLGVRAGDRLRKAAKTSSAALPPPRKISAEEVLKLAPGLEPNGLRGGVVFWDGQLEDDARFVTCLARTAAAQGADVRTHARVLDATGTGALLRDELTGDEMRVTARAVINATGVWSDVLVDGIRLSPSRGAHLVLSNEALGGITAGVNVPVPGSANRWVFALPQSDGTVFVGLTDDPVEKVDDIPQASDQDIDFLLDVINRALARPLTRADILGTFAGLRPLLQADGSTADLSRKHAVIKADNGVVTIVGGKFTTYRQMAEDALDATELTTTECTTRRLPLLGAAARDELAKVDAPERLVRRFGTEAPYVLEQARKASGLSDEELTEPGPRGVTLAELIFGVTHEGAADVDDLLDRRTRVGLVPSDRDAATPLAVRALELASG